MKELFQRAIEWLRRKVTDIKREEEKVKSKKVKDTRNLCVNENLLGVKGGGLKVKDTQGVYENENEDDNLPKVKGDRLEASKGRNSVAERPRNDDGKSFNSHLSSFNSKLTIPDIERLLREKYELRYNVLTEQSEYRAKGSDGAFRAVT